MVQFFLALSGLVGPVPASCTVLGAFDEGVSAKSATGYHIHIHISMYIYIFVYKKMSSHILEITRIVAEGTVL